MLYLRDLCLTQGHKDFPVLKFSNFVFDSDARSTFGYYVYTVRVQTTVIFPTYNAQLFQLCFFR